MKANGFDNTLKSTKLKLRENFSVELKILMFSTTLSSSKIIFGFGLNIFNFDRGPYGHIWNAEIHLAYI